MCKSISMEQFNPLLSRYAAVKLVEFNSEKVLFDGAFKDMPDLYESYTVRNFSMDNAGRLTFVVEL